MDLLFCDVCNESVPQKDLDEGRAVRRKGHVVCASCEGAMSGDAHRTDAGGAVEREQVGAGAGRVAPEGSAPAAARAATGTHAAAGHATARRRERSGGAWTVLAVLLGLTALAVAVGGSLFVHDRLSGETTARREAVTDVRAFLQGANERILERLEGELRGLATTADRLAEDVAALERRLDEAGREERQRTDGLRAELSALGQRLTGVEALEQGLEQLDLDVQQVGRFTADLHEQQLRLTDRLEVLRSDLGSVRDLASVDVGALVGAGAPAEPPAEERPAWLDFVGDLKSQSASVRWQAVQSIGQSGDEAAAEYLAPMLKDPDLFVRMAAARNLGDLAAPLGIPALIDALEDPEESVRDSVAVSLRAITSKDFRFDPSAKESERAKAVKRWREWWEGARDDFATAG